MKSHTEMMIEQAFCDRQALRLLGLERFMVQMAIFRVSNSNRYVSMSILLIDFAVKILTCSLLHSIFTG